MQNLLNIKILIVVCILFIFYCDLRSICSLLSAYAKENNSGYQKCKYQMNNFTIIHLATVVYLFTLFYKLTMFVLLMKY